MTNIHDKYAQRHYETAMVFFEEGNYKKALSQMEQAIKKAPSNPDYYSMKGVFFHKMNDIISAISSYEKAIEVDNQHVFSHYNLGLIYMKQNKVIQAINEWKAVIRVNPNDIDAIFNIGVALSHLGKKSEAIKFYDKVLKINPNHIQAHQNLGVIYRDDANFKQAKFHFKMLAECDSTYIEVVNEEILKCEEQEFLNKITNNNSGLDTEFGQNTQDETLSSALMALINNDNDLALKICDKLLNDKPLDIQLLLIRGQALSNLSQNSEAISVFKNIIAKEPKNEDALFHLGNIFLRLGELDKALDFFKKLKMINPEYPFVKENINSIISKIQTGKTE